MSGKEIIIERLRDTNRIRNLRFLDKEKSGKIFDLNSQKYKTYKQGDTLYFKKQMKSEIKKDVMSRLKKPEWMPEYLYKEILHAKKESLRNEFLDKALNNYDEKTDELYNKFITLSSNQLNFKKEKGQNNLFAVEYLVNGMLDEDLIRFPFALQEITELKIDKKNRTVKVIKSDRYIPNIPFISWLGNKRNINTEKYLKDLSELDKSNFISKQLEIYSKLGIELKEINFSNLKPKELKLKTENKNSKSDLEIAIKLSKLTVFALLSDIEVYSIDINNINYTIGRINSLLKNEQSFEKEFDFLILPYIDEEDFYDKKNSVKSFYESNEDDDEEIDENCISDIEIIFNKLDEKFSDEIEKRKFYNSRKYEIQRKLFENKQTINFFTEYLLKHKSMDEEEIHEQFHSDKLIDSFNKAIDEIKFQKNSFDVEKVNLICRYDEIASSSIINDVIKIFETNFIDSFLFNENNAITLNKNETFSEEKICWGFNADIHQQKAVFNTTKYNNIIIQGPPGTGKTQTILNIINEYLSQNKKILIVSEKITAVDVIRTRINKHAPQLSNLLLNLYNIDNNDPSFLNDVGKKVETMFSEKIIYKTKLKTKPLFENNQQKEDISNELSEKINSFSLREKFDKWKNVNITNEQMTMYNTLKKSHINEILKITESEYLEFCNWKDKKKQLEKFSDEYKIRTIDKTIISKILKFNESNPFNKYNMHKYASLFLRNSEKVFFLFKNKFKKEAENMKLTDIFNNFENLSLLKEFSKFDFSKHLKKQSIFETYEKAKNASLSFKKIEEIFVYLNDVMEFENIDNQIQFNELFKFFDINDDDKKFAEAHDFIFRNHCLIVQKMLDNHNDIKKDLLSFKDRRKWTMKAKLFFKEYWNYLYKIFPVVLSTPETLSNYAPLEERMFDVILIDEASQFLIERAIPALYRGNKKIVSGDKNQLRPKIDGQRFSSDKQFDEKTQYETLIRNESILDLFNETFHDRDNNTQFMLKIHYRSEKKELIEFSNQEFYDGELKFLEHVSKINSKNSIEVIDVNGEWQNQTNKIEAEKIIEKLKEIYLNDKNASVGVIVFTKKQARLIEHILYKYSENKIIIDKLHDSDSDSLFIKSIEDVQGEERDIIIFGITYGNNVHNYGSISHLYGQNKINVAITRSKKQMVVIKSHKAKDYRRINDSKFNACFILFKFLEYVETLADNKDFYDFANNNEINDCVFMEYLNKNHVNISNKIFIGSKIFYIEKFNRELSKAYYLIDEKTLNNPRENLWFYEKILKNKGYTSRPISILRLYDFRKKIISNIDLKI